MLVDAAIRLDELACYKLTRTRCDVRFRVVLLENSYEVQVHNLLSENLGTRHFPDFRISEWKIFSVDFNVF